ncbi:hypothetical protein Tco_0831750 [Tanacetum coccineum]
MLAMTIFFLNCLYLGWAATSKRWLQPWRVDGVDMWGYGVPRIGKKNNKDKNLELLKLHEVEQATEVMNALQGSMLPSSDRGGMHIELVIFRIL